MGRNKGRAKKKAKAQKKGRAKKNRADAGGEARTDLAALGYLAGAVSIHVSLKLIAIKSPKRVEPVPNMFSAFWIDGNGDVERFFSKNQYEIPGSLAPAFREARLHVAESFEPTLRGMNEPQKDWILDAFTRHSMQALVDDDVAPWSLAVCFEKYQCSKDLTDISVILFVGPSFVIRYLDSITVVIPRLLDCLRTDRKHFNGDCCWICLEEFDKQDLACDYFGCGHNVCCDCKDTVKDLKSCGVCRSGRKLDRGFAKTVSQLSERMAGRDGPLDDEEFRALLWEEIRSPRQGVAELLCPD